MTPSITAWPPTRVVSSPFSRTGIKSVWVKNLKYVRRDTEILPSFNIHYSAKHPEPLSVHSDQLAGEPRSGEIPVALERGHGDSQRLGRFLFAQAAEVAQLDDFSGAPVQRLQPRQGFVNRQQAFVAIHHGAVRIGQGNFDLAAAPLFALP